MAKPITPVGRASYPRVFRAEQIMGQGEPKYQLTMIFDPNEPKLKEMREAVKKVVQTKWRGEKPRNFQSPFVDGDELDGEENKGKIIVRFRTGDKGKAPEVVDQKKHPISEDSGAFYAGCYCRCTYSVYAWEYMGKTGVSFALGNIQKIREGEPFDGRTTASEDFDEVEDDESNTPSGWLDDDDDVPF